MGAGSRAGGSTTSPAIFARICCRRWGPHLIEPHLEPGKAHDLKIVRRYQDEAITWGWQPDDELRRAYDRSGAGWTITKFGNDRLLRTFLSYVRENHAESVSDDRVLAAGLRDWGLKPFVGACHAWRSGANPTLVINYLKGFSMLPSVRKPACRLHVCGEAYSDYQGFVEGARRPKCSPALRSGSGRTTCASGSGGSGGPDV